MYVKVIDAKCCGYTVCADLCPEVYKLDEQGFAYVESDLVPPELVEKAVQGAKSCPEAAIELSETPFE